MKIMDNASNKQYKDNLTPYLKENSLHTHTHTHTHTHNNAYEVQVCENSWYTWCNV